MTGRHILGRARLDKSEAGYNGRLVLWGFAYQVEVTRTSDGVELVAYEGAEPEISPEYRVPAIDGEGG